MVVKLWRLDPLEYEECLEYVQQGRCQRLIVPRSLPELDQLIDHICFLRGSYLITGYRGVGKTSFINYALALAHQRLSGLEQAGVLVRVPLSLARNYEIEKLLRRTIRQLYEALIQTEIEWHIGSGRVRSSLYALLPDDLKAELTVAYQKTSAKVSEAATEALRTVIATATTGELDLRGEVGGEATIRPDPLPAKLGMKLSGGYKRSKTTSKEEETARETVDSLEYLEYDDEIAEAELVRLIKRLTRTPTSLRYQELRLIPRRLPWLWRMWGRIRHRNYLQQTVEREEARNLHLVFVFDELDKVAPDDAERMLRSLKGLLLTSDATFIFIGGWEFASRWLSRTQPEGDLLYSLFNDVVYVPLYTDEELDTLIRELVVASSQSQGDKDFEYLCRHIKLHCGRTPREFLRQLLRFVRWEKGKLILDVHQEGILFPRLFPHVHQVNSRIGDTLPSEVRDALIRRTDQWLMVAEREVVFSFDTIFKVSTGLERTEARGGIWQQSLRGHFDHFFDVMLEAGVFQLEQSTGEELYRFNPEFSLGTWRRRVPAPPPPEKHEAPVVSPRPLEEKIATVKVGMLARGTTGASTGPFEAPPELAHFVNREEELRAIKQAIETRVSLVQIVGLGGVGKTALAIAVAHEMRDRFPDGVLWVTLEPGTTLENVLHHIALSYGQVLADMEVETLAAQVRALLASKKAFVVLDSAENLSENEIEQLLPGTSNCSVLATTRTRLTKLERFGQTFSLDVLPAEHSLSLLRRSAGYRRVSTARDVALEVCQLLGHLPLAIEIAGHLAQARGWDMQSLLENLQASMRDVSEMDRPISSVTHAFSTSYDSLSNEQKRVLVACSVFKGHFSVDGLAYLIGAEPKGTVEYLLYGLVNRSLVSRDRNQAFRVHPLIRAYVHSVADQSGLEKMRSRHARYVLRWVRKVKGEAR